MQIQYIMVLLAGLVLAGCGKSPSPAPAKATNAPKSGGPGVLTAPVDYLGAAAQAKKQSDKTIELVSLRQAIQQFYAMEGRWPKDLNELVKEKYLPIIPTPPHGMKIQYDAAKGEVKIVSQ